MSTLSSFLAGAVAVFSPYPPAVLLFPFHFPVWAPTSRPSTSIPALCGGKGRTEPFVRRYSATDFVKLSVHQPYDELPDKKRVWVGTPSSRKEGVARLAPLTPYVVAKAAASEIQTGKHIYLNWELETAGFGRQPFEHNIIKCYDSLFSDDTYAFNPQQGSQQDDLRHFLQAVPGTEGKGPDQRVS
ncbi:hypothetical protein E8E12_008610 [Didymella heteroderae]|uniref:Uncharacterized protein n=1 Tax=Didymella heteroderae TaxID=1769908 RepID=A0A9P5C1J9_9PLEO|nr:hypothetical protein E8E12_008610 [Didymella heteroderae]